MRRIAMKFICPLCGEVYDEEKADIPFADLPETWACPLCYAPRNSFRPEEGEPGPRSGGKEDAE